MILVHIFLIGLFASSLENGFLLLLAQFTYLFHILLFFIHIEILQRFYLLNSFIFSFYIFCWLFISLDKIGVIKCLFVVVPDALYSIDSFLHALSLSIIRLWLHMMCEYIAVASIGAGSS